MAGRFRGCECCRDFASTIQEMLSHADAILREPCPEGLHSLRCTISRMQFKPQVILDSDPWIRDYIEVVCDTTPTTQSIVAFICKVCWKQFENSGSAFSLLAHAEMHKARQERPYQTRRQLFFSGEDILERSRILTEQFAVVTPEVGAWKFQCRTCSKIFPHRTDCDELIEHGTRCQLTRMAATTQ